MSGLDRTQLDAWQVLSEDAERERDDLRAEVERLRRERDDALGVARIRGDVIAGLTADYERASERLRSLVRRVRVLEDALQAEVDAKADACGALIAVRNLTRYQETDPSSVRAVGLRVADIVNAAVVTASLTDGEDLLDAGGGEEP